MLAILNTPIYRVAGADCADARAMPPPGGGADLGLRSQRWIPWPTLPRIDARDWQLRSMCRFSEAVLGLRASNARSWQAIGAPHRGAPQPRAGVPHGGGVGSAH